MRLEIPADSSKWMRDVIQCLFLVAERLLAALAFNLALLMHSVVMLEYVSAASSNTILVYLDT